MQKQVSFLILFALLVSGCTSSEKPIGGDKDEHGCLISAGYSWCESKQKCLRTWEEACPGMVRSFEECEALGYPVMESDPRQCRTPKGELFTEDIEDAWDAKARYIAETYATNMEQYKKENGRNLKIIDLKQARCHGCWQVELQYDLDLGKEAAGNYTNDRIIANITLNNWTVVDAFVARGGIFLQENACATDSDCQTPASYLIRSNCPYTSKCIDSRCEVVCPSYKYSESQDNSGGYQTYPVTCKKDTDCDCTDYTLKDMDRCSCLEGGCFAVIKE